MEEAELAVEGLTKTFPGTRALSDFSLDLKPGQVHALMGENGAGKTTLLMILSGVLSPDAGRILMRGKEVRFSSPRDAQNAGLGTVFQELSLVEGLTIAENVFANRAPAGALGWIDHRRMAQETRELLRLLGSDLSPASRLASLSVGSRQIVEIAKALSLRARVLLMDEPTSALSATETRTLFSVIERLKRQGLAVLFVSHRLAEVFEVADRISVMRDGCLVGTYPRAAIDPDRAVRLMVGRVLSSLYPDRSGERGPARLEIRGLKATRLGPIDLTVYAGEIVGLAGLRGSGRSRLAKAIFGALPRDAGEVRVDGQRLPPGNPLQSVRHQVAFVPAERTEEGVFLRMSLADNLISASLGGVSRWGLVVSPIAARLAQRLIHDFGIRAAGIRQLVSRLSGGNQQKAVLAKWLAARPRLLIVDDPTRGIDVGAKAEIHTMLRDLARQGIAILMTSSDLPELLGMCDRIAVMAGGTIRAVLEGKTATEEQVMAYAAGAEAA